MRRVLGRFILPALAYICRALAIVAAGLTVILCFVSAAKAGVLFLVSFFDRIVPASISGVLVVPTLFGGAFRGDFCILSVALFVLDWALMRIGNSLARGRG